MSYVTVQEVANRLDRPVHATIAQSIIDQVEATVDAWAGFPIARSVGRTRTEVVDSATRAMDLYLPGGVSVQDVKVDGVSLTPATDWVFVAPTHTLYITRYMFLRSTVTVTYTGGFDPVPQALRAIVLNAAARAYDRPVGGVRQHMIGDFSETFDTETSGGVVLTEQEREDIDNILATL